MICLCSAIVCLFVEVVTLSVCLIREKGFSSFNYNTIIIILLIVDVTAFSLAVVAFFLSEPPDLTKKEEREQKRKQRDEQETEEETIRQLTATVTELQKQLATMKAGNDG